MKYLLVLILGAFFITGCSNPEVLPDIEISSKDTYQVLIVGAGAAGLSAAAELEKEGIDYRVIEARKKYGGRLSANYELADFPIDLGAEWIHEDPSILAEISGDPNILDAVEVIPYDIQQMLFWNGERLEDHSDEIENPPEHKFKNTTWFDFYDNYVVPSVKDNIIYNRAVSEIDYTNDQVIIKTINGTDYAPTEIYQADAVIVAVPITILQQNYIRFVPDLSAKKKTALNQIKMSAGLKIFMTFSEHFYPEVLILNEYDEDFPYDEKTFYDAAFGKESENHVMGVLLVGEPATPYLNLDEKSVIELLLTELDEIFEGKASATYEDHIVQNWSSEPYILGTYTTDIDEKLDQTLRKVKQPIDDRIFFAGGALDSEEPGTVPGAYRSAVEAVDLVFKMFK